MMNSQDGEGNNNQLPPIANPAAVVDSPLNATVEPNVGVSSNPLDKLENVTGAGTLEVAPDSKPPTEQFVSQFGSGVTSPVAEAAELNPTDSKETPVEKPNPSTETLGDLLTKGPQTAEAEKTPAEKLREQISNAVEEFLNAEGGKVATS